MSIKVMSEVWELDLPPSQKLVALAFADFANEEGICFPSVARIAKKSGYSLRQTKTIINDLRTAEILVPIRNFDPRTKCGGGRGADGKGRAVVYMVCSRNGAKIAPSAESKQCNSGQQRVQSGVAEGCKITSERVRPTAPQPSGTVKEPSLRTVSEENSETARITQTMSSEVENLAANLRMNRPAKSQPPEEKTEDQKALESCIYRDRLFRTHDDCVLGNVAWLELAREVLKTAVSDLLGKRGFRELRGCQFEATVEAAWHALEPELEQMKRVKSLKRRRLLIAKVIECTVRAGKIEQQKAREECAA